MFKATMPYEPYFLVTCRVSRITPRNDSLICVLQAGSETVVEEWLLKRYEGVLLRVQREKKWDLDLVCNSAKMVLC